MSFTCVIQLPLCQRAELNIFIEKTAHFLNTENFGSDMKSFPCCKSLVCISEVLFFYAAWNIDLVVAIILIGKFREALML